MNKDKGDNKQNNYTSTENKTSKHLGNISNQQTKTSVHINDETHSYGDSDFNNKERLIDILPFNFLKLIEEAKSEGQINLLDEIFYINAYLGLLAKQLHSPYKAFTDWENLLGLINNPNFESNESKVCHEIIEQIKNINTNMHLFDKINKEIFHAIDLKLRLVSQFWELNNKENPNFINNNYMPLIIKLSEIVRETLVDEPILISSAEARQKILMRFAGISLGH